MVGKPEHLKDLIYWDLDEIEDIFVATDAYISRLPQDAVTTKAILESSTLMLLDKNNMTRQYIDDYLSKNRIQTRDYIEISSMDLLIEFARIGLGVACVIKNFVTDDLSSGALTQIALDIPIHKRRVGFAYKKNTPAESRTKQIFGKSGADSGIKQRGTGIIFLYLKRYVLTTLIKRILCPFTAFINYLLICPLHYSSCTAYESPHQPFRTDAHLPAFSSP